MGARTRGAISASGHGIGVNAGTARIHRVGRSATGMRPVLERMQFGGMYGECTTLSEALLAIRTGVGFFAGVRANVLGQVVLDAERLLTVVALERLFTWKQDVTTMATRTNTALARLFIDCWRIEVWRK